MDSQNKNSDFINLKININLNPEEEISSLLTALLQKDTASFLPFQNKIFSVGGFVRDEFLNITSNDLDLVIEIQNGAELFANELHL